MPFIDQRGLDWFLMNCSGQSFRYRISLHTEDVASDANELTATSAPGYARQTAQFGPRTTVAPQRIQNTEAIAFGPATQTWPTVHSIGLRSSVLVDNGAGVLSAYHTLSAEQRFTLGEHFSYTIEAGHVYIEAPEFTDDSLGWHGDITFLDDIVGLDPDFAGATGSYRLDPGGTHEDDASNAFDLPCVLAVYAYNPLAQGGNLHTPLRTASQLGSEMLTGYGNFYYSPQYHALVNRSVLKTGGGDAGTATHWIVGRSNRIGDVTRSSTLFLGAFANPGVTLTQDQTMTWARRAVRLPMTHS